MNFFEHQDRARRRTGVLVLLFSVAVVLIVLVTYAACAIVLGYAGSTQLEIWSPELFGVVAGIVFLIVGSSSGYKILSLRGGGGSVAEMLGGRAVNNLSDDADEQRLVNVIEEMAIASGVPVPLIYVLDNEQAINAFAAGHGPEDAVVAVTRGALTQLSRDELQGVIAHEFSHILNRDVRLNTRLTGLLFGILALALAGRMVLRGFGRVRISRSSDRGGGAGVLVVIAIAIILMVIGHIGLFFAKLIQMAVSRQREFLADASAVQFTRHPEGLASALKKIGTWAHGAEVESPSAVEISHFFFADGIKHRFLRSAMSTHPPLAERIRRLDPSFDGSLDIEADDHTDGAISDTGATIGLVSGAPVNVPPAEIVETVGTTEREKFAYDDAVTIEISDRLREQVTTTFGAIAVVYAFLLDPDPAKKTLQLDLLTEKLPTDFINEISEIRPIIDQVDQFARLPTVDLAMPALRWMSSSQYDEFVRIMDELIEGDQHLTLFEYSVRSIIKHRLGAQFGKKPAYHYRPSKATLARDSAILLAGLARIGHESEEEVVAAYLAGVGRLVGAKTRVEYDSELVGHPTAAEIDAAILRLEQLPDRRKQTIVDACAYCALSDRDVTIEEAELLRVVIVALGCSLPPFLPST